MATSIIKSIPLEEKTLTTSSLNHLKSATAKLYRKGNVGVVEINALNTTSSLPAGEDASFQVDGLPSIAAQGKGMGYSGASGIFVTVTPSGRVVLRPIGYQWVQSYNVVADVIVVFS